MEKFISFFKRTKKFFNNKTFKIFYVSFLTTILTVLLLLFIVWSFKDKILSFVINNYIAQINVSKSKPILIEKIEEVSSVVKEIKKEEKTVVNAVKKAKPAVVSIIISKEVPQTDITYDKDGETKISTLETTKLQRVGNGSGFLVSSDGIIVTNRHVVDKLDLIYTVMLNDGREYRAKILAQDPVLDLTIIKIDGENLPYLKLANSDLLEVGESVVAIGNALGEFKNTVSTGVVSGLSRNVLASGSGGLKEFLYKVIQTDAAINKGNSGGPLLNLSGEVVGVNVALAEDSSNIGFSLPINSIKGVIDQVKKTGKISRPYIGIRYINITEEIKEKLKLPVSYGVLIIKGGDDEPAVMPDSPAAKIGLEENDIILSVDGETITFNNDFLSLIRSKKVGDKIILLILSKGVQKIETLTLSEAE